MSYIGNTPFSTAFVTDYFTGDGTTTAYTLSVAPAGSTSVLVQLSAAVQSPADYSVVGATITFSAPPPAGIAIIVRCLGIPASGVTTTAYRTITEFTATASQTTFTPASYVPGFLNVYQNGVMLGSTDYTATNGTTVVLAVGATAGDLITTEGFYVSSVINAIPAQSGAIVASYLAGGAASQAFLDAATGTGTGALKLPVGTTAERPTGAAGLIRQNSTTGNPEWWDATTSTWLQFSQPAGYSVSYLVVGGGGGGSGVASSNPGGGGGAGGMLTGTANFSSGTSYTITVGGGGAAGTSAPTSGVNGSDSVISTVATAIGGGRGEPLSGSGGVGSGGSGGGTGKASGAGSGTAGQGNAGGNSASQPNASGGGGGASAVGGNGVSNGGGSGGAGASNSISGTPVFYAGGGGGSGYNNGGVGGIGGGGNGALAAIGPGTAGTANTGGGGGGGGYAGGSGIVIISYLGSQRGTGGTVTSSGGYTIHTFTSSGTYNA